jgi:hypothetical protein
MAGLGQTVGGREPTGARTDHGDRALWHATPPPSAAPPMRSLDDDVAQHVTEMSLWQLTAEAADG